MPVPTTQLANATEQTGDSVLNSIQSTQQRTAAAVNSRGAPPNVLEPVTFTAGGQVKMSHKLQRLPTEWDAIDVTGGYGKFQRVSWDDVYITIQSEDACTAVFRVA